jgi:hypothetical protein
VQCVLHALKQQRTVGQPRKAVARVVELARGGHQAGVAAFGQHDARLREQPRIRGPATDLLLQHVDRGPAPHQMGVDQGRRRHAPGEGADVGKALRPALRESLAVRQPARHHLR